MDAAATQPKPTADRVPRRRTVRWVVRLVLLLLAVVALLPVLSETRWPVTVPAFSPFVAAAAIVATHTVTASMWIGIAVALVAVFRRRWFCRWVCPTGTCADLAGRPAFWAGRRCPRLFAVGSWIAWLTLGGAMLGYPFLLWLDPLAMFSGTFSLSLARLHDGSSSAVWWSCLSMAGVLVLSAVWPGLWCLRICPLGAVQDGLAWFGRLLARVVRIPRADHQPAGEPGPTRRTVLGGLAGVLATAAGATLAAATRTGRTASAGPLRPPGALDEDEFVGVCVRCGNCSRACPTNIVRLDLGEHGIAGLLTPRLDFQNEYCREDCTRCTDVCPSGALTRLTVAEKPQAAIGFPWVDMNVCLLGEDRDCAVCRNWCPYEAIKLVFSKENYTLVPEIDPDKCPGCGACEMACPTEPVKAIVVERVVTPKRSARL